MNIFTKALLGSTLVLGSIFGSVSPAEAGTCWYMNGVENGRVNGEYCKVSTRVNYNGHRVFDITDGNGRDFTIVLWTDGVAEVIGLTDRPQQVKYYRDRQGDARLVWSDGFEFSFRF